MGASLHLGALGCRSCWRGSRRREELEQLDAREHGLAILSMRRRRLSFVSATERWSASFWWPKLWCIACICHSRPSKRLSMFLNLACISPNCSSCRISRSWQRSRNSCRTMKWLVHVMYGPWSFLGEVVGSTHRAYTSCKTHKYCIWKWNMVVLALYLTLGIAPN